MIDKRADIHPSARISPNVTIGPWTTIGENVEIGEGTEIGPNVFIQKNTRIGKQNKIFPFASVGSDPQHLAFAGEETWLEMGDGNTVREYVTLNRGTKQGGGLTKIGDHNLIMSCSHVAHDCVVGNHVVFANTATIAGHVVVGDHSVLGGLTAVHQFVTIGAYSFLGRATKVAQDILPFMLVTGNPGAPRCINRVGLKRQGFSDETLLVLKQAFSLIYRKRLKHDALYEALTALSADTPEVDVLIDFIKRSKRGIARHG
jgi:UDP-N-acetylglucosamine acyltransferase